MSRLVLQIENVSKVYRLGQVGTGTLLQDINRWWQIQRGNPDPYLVLGEANDRTRKGSTIVRALNDINLTVKQGEVLGIIGRNGAGKSTLLKLLSRVTYPSAGSISVKGKLVSLLEVGTGFHPELTGRENVYLNGAILGMSKSEVKSKLDAIVDFAGVANYLDTPVKRYSSGMKVRLGFAVAAHLEPDILIVDEVLAVGDAEFQQKAIGKMQDVSSRGGRTVLFVSHNMLSVKRLCNRAVLLNNGQLTMDGTPEEVIQGYLKSNLGTSNNSGEIHFGETAPGSAELKLVHLSLEGKSGLVKNTFSTEEAIKLNISYRIFAPIKNFRFVFQLLDNEENCIFTSTNQNTNIRTFEEGLYKTTCVIPGELLNEGTYKIKLAAGIQGVKPLLDPQIFMSFKTFFIDSDDKPAYSHKRWPGLIAPVLKWENV